MKNEKTDDHNINLEEQFNKLFISSKLTESPEKIEKTMRMINEISRKFPELKLEFRWNQPTFILGKTFIAGISVAKGWVSFAAEYYSEFAKNPEIEAQNFEKTKYLVQFPFADFDKDFDKNFDFVSRMIANQIREKRGSEKFWR